MAVYFLFDIRFVVKVKKSSDEGIRKEKKLPK